MAGFPGFPRVDRLAGRAGEAIFKALTPRTAEPSGVPGPQSARSYFTDQLRAMDPRTPSGAVNLMALFAPHIGGRYALSPYARNPARVFRTEDLMPGLAFRHTGGIAPLSRAITQGEGLHTPVEIDWGPTSGLAAIIQGNHRLLAAQETEHPLIPATLGQMYGDMARWLKYLRAGPNKPHHEYGSIQAGRADQGLINRLLELSDTNYDTGGLYHFKRNVKVTPEDWDALIGSLKLPNVRVQPGTTVEQAAAMFDPPYRPGG